MSVEMWQSQTQGEVALPSWDDQGRMRVVMVRAGAKVTVRTADREQAQSMSERNPFDNGMLIRVDAGEGPRGGGAKVEELPNILKLRGQKFADAIEELSEFDARRLLEAAEADEDIPASRLKTLKDLVTRKFVRQGPVPSYSDIAGAGGR